MTEVMNQELLFFFKSILTGVFIVFIYDILRICRRIIKHGNIAIALEDLTYWLGIGFLVFIVMYRENNGEIRGYAIIGIGLGMIVYSGSFSKLLVEYSSKIINFILKITRRFIYIILTPIRFIAKKISVKTKKGKKVILKRLKKYLKEVRIVIGKK